jgi:lactose/cellobiose-specific phosphotransferase system IIC component
MRLPLIPAVWRAGANRLLHWVDAIRNSFVTLIPWTFLGLLGTLLQFAPWTGHHVVLEWLLGANWFSRLGILHTATHGMFGLALATLVAVHLVLKKPVSNGHAFSIPTLLVGLSALFNFMVVALSLGVPWTELGRPSILMGIAVGIYSVEVLRWLVRSPLMRLVDDAYDAEVSFYYAIRLAPVFFVAGLVVFALAQMVRMLPPVPLDVMQPLVVWAQSGPVDGIWWLSSLAVVLYQGTWFLGISGASVLDVYFLGLFTPDNQPYSSALAYRPLFNYFVLLGGTGATLGLLLALLWGTRSGRQRKIAWVSVPLAAFNINESLLYGLPVVLNASYVVPFFAVPVVLNLLAVAAAQSGWLTIVDTQATWTLPPLWSGWALTQSWQGVALQALFLCISVLMYLPFVRRAEARRLDDERLAFSAAMKEVAHAAQPTKALYTRQDYLGIFARSLMRDLREELSAHQGRLRLVYQPKHDEHGRVVGVEALIRWQHDLHGVISPMVLILLAEDSRDILAVGEWVLNEACACKARWNRQGLGRVKMSVNISPLQLSDPQLVHKVSRTLALHGLQPGEIELEVTESAELPDVPMVNQNLNALVQMGVDLSMDDFGMGYTSLLYMRRFAMSAIKIDGSLTRDVLLEKTNAEIIRTIANLGRAQHVEVVAEYVETAEQRDCLLELGCNVFQGYLYSPPLSESDCMGYIERNLNG